MNGCEEYKDYPLDEERAVSQVVEILLTEEWIREVHAQRHFAWSAFRTKVEEEELCAEEWEVFWLKWVARAAVREVADVISRMNCPQSCWYAGPARDGYCTAMHQVKAALKADKGE